MSPEGLDATGLERYARQLVMPEIGPEGQAKLGTATVLVVGAGGLGSPVIQYLAGAGVGTLLIVDPDVVERSNLHRQTIHGESDVGRPKVESAADFVERTNPEVSVEPIQRSVTVDFATEHFPDVDVVVDGTDDFEAHFRCNDVAVLTGTPLVAGGVGRFEGQLTTVLPSGSSSERSGPCYRCLFPEAPPAGTVPDCASAGVLGVVPGTIGTLQATETLKHLLDVGEPLAGRLLVYDAEAMTVETIDFDRRPTCPVCGEDPISDPATLVYDDRCRLR